ncbi:MAG: hypothetical protein D6819_06505 [Gammaproteobacteria bacterium]|nr:MAG: hypothetical protein D6819_06505 [Gammaproteobacteria bacterium]
MSVRLVALGLLICLVGGCQSHSDPLADLKAYVQSLPAKYKGRIEPLPKFEPFEPYVYHASGLRDPFVPPKREAPEEAAASGIHPDFNRPKEPLEQFPLDALRMVGTVQKEGELWALVKAPDGVVHKVQVGQHMGQNYGRIVRITPTSIELVEIVPDGRGGWKERPAKIELSG